MIIQSVVGSMLVLIEFVWTALRKAHLVLDTGYRSRQTAIRSLLANAQYGIQRSFQWRYQYIWGLIRPDFFVRRNTLIKATEDIWFQLSLRERTCSICFSSRLWKDLKNIEFIRQLYNSSFHCYYNFYFLFITCVFITYCFLM